MDHSHYLEDDPDLVDATYGDERLKADANASPCRHCGVPVRWIRNESGQREDSRLQITARPVARPAWFDSQEHAGLIAVFWDRSGFAVARFTKWSQVKESFLYRCHWDECDKARAERDARHVAGVVLRAQVEDDPS